ncbi:MAG TPA: NADPH:quinone oxidoreductase family protein [Candidatus Elarobacter sp.]
MRAVQVHTLGSPRDLQFVDVVLAPPGKGEIAIDVHAAGVNFPDALMVQGKYQTKPPLPFTLGVEVAGVVTALGEGVRDVAVGDRVAALPRSGGFAEAAICGAHSAVVLPDAVDFVTGAAMLMTYGTAYHGLVDRGHVKEGERVAVTGAGGGVGTAAVDIASGLGARTIAIVGSEAKREAALHAGATNAVVAAAELANALKELAGGLDVLLDNVGGDVFDAALRALDWNGRALIVGFAGGRIPEIPANRLLLRETSAVGVYWGPWTEKQPAHNRANFAAMFAMMADGKLHPKAHERFAFDDVPLAMEAMMGRTLVGKAVVVVRE